MKANLHLQMWLAPLSTQKNRSPPVTIRARSSMYTPMSPSEASADLLHPDLRAYLAQYLRRRLPKTEADDALQAVYCAALEARNIPQDRAHLRRWMTVIARRQVAAYYERASAEQLSEPVDLPDVEWRANAAEVRSLWQWAEQQAADSQLEAVDETLDWMARESDGEKLESIAADARIPSARIRQRVFRLRRFMKARWILEISAAAVLIAITSWVLSRRSDPVVVRRVVPRPPVSITLPLNAPLIRAAELRKTAFKLCDQNAFESCLRLLDDAAALDLQGDTDLQVIAARKLAQDNLRPPPPPSPSVVPPPRTRSTSTTPTGSRFDSSGTP